MTARVWTVEELDWVHKLPDGWAWEIHGGKPRAMAAAPDPPIDCTGDWHVWVDDLGELASQAIGPRCYREGETDHVDPPADVALAVILASKGLDSLGAMADAMEREAAASDGANARTNAQRSIACGIRQGLWSAIIMLRRGTVQP